MKVKKTRILPAIIVVLIILSGCESPAPKRQTSCDDIRSAEDLYECLSQANAGDANAAWGIARIYDHKGRYSYSLSSFSVKYGFIRDVYLFHHILSRVLTENKKRQTVRNIAACDLVPDIEKLPSIILRHASQPTKRGLVILNVIRECFCQFSVKQIRGCIEQMLKEGKLKSETGKNRINNTVKIFAVT